MDGINYLESKTYFQIQLQYDYVDSAVNNYLDYNNVQYQEYHGDVPDYSYQYHPPSSPPHRPHQPPPGWSQHHRVISPQHYQSHSTRRQEIVDRQDAGILSGTGVLDVASLRN